MKLSEMKQLLSARGWMLTKSLGQNFLHDQNQLRRIADAAELTPSDQVLEVGPGLGPLTRILLERAGRVLAVETDARMVGYLRETLAGPKLELLHADALAVVRDRRDWSDWKLVANLPYSVASPILVELALSPTPPRLMVVTLQSEVAQRLMAAADDDHYGVLTLLVGLNFQVRGKFKIPAECFFPAPEVESMCIVLERRPQFLLPEERRGVFVKIVKRAFSQRRKMMLKLLKQDWPPEHLAAAFARLGLSPQERAEKLDLRKWVELTQFLTDAKAVGEEIFDVVNERDEVVGQSPRRVVHAQGLRHRAVHVFVFGSDGRVFLQKRSMSKDTHPGVWDSSASGHLDAGEDYDACAVRELGEEIGLAPAVPPRRLFKISACAETGQEFVWVYRVESDGPFVLHPEEIERGDWFEPDHLTRWIGTAPQELAPALVLIWKSLTGGARIP